MAVAHLHGDDVSRCPAPKRPRILSRPSHRPARAHRLVGIRTHTYTYTGGINTVINRTSSPRGTFGPVSPPRGWHSHTETYKVRPRSRITRALFVGGGGSSCPPWCRRRPKIREETETAAEPATYLLPSRPDRAAASIAFLTPPEAPPPPPPTPGQREVVMSCDLSFNIPPFLAGRRSYTHACMHACIIYSTTSRARQAKHRPKVKPARSRRAPSPSSATGRRLGPRVPRCWSSQEDKKLLSRARGFAGT